MTITSPHVRTVWVELEIDARGSRRVLELDPAEEAVYEADKVEALIADLAQHRDSIGYINRVRVVANPKTVLDMLVAPAVKTVSGTFGPSRF
jgi:hypothetical protein